MPFIDQETQRMEAYPSILRSVDIGAAIQEKYRGLQLSEELIDFQKKLLERDPSKRPGFKDILEAQWFDERVPEVFEDGDPEQIAEGL